MENAMPQALLLIDLQNDYFPGGALPLAGSEAAVAQAARALDRARQDGWPVIHVQHLARRPGAGFFLPDTGGAEIHPRVAPAAGEAVVVKHFPNAFRDTPLTGLLAERGITELVIAGAMSHMCIDATTRAAADAGFTVTLLADACATRDLVFRGRTVAAADVHAAFMAALSGLYARVLDTEGWLAEVS
jgi:nicotinamidase-related amidase